MRTQAIRGVRFLLTMPEGREEAVTRTTRGGGKLRPALIVKPKDPKPEKKKFPKSSAWGREQLRDLGVTFQRKPKLDLNKIWKGKVDAWPDDVQKSTLLFPSILTVI